MPYQDSSNHASAGVAPTYRALPFQNAPSAVSFHQDSYHQTESGHAQPCLVPALPYLTLPNPVPPDPTTFRKVAPQLVEPRCCRPHRTVPGNDLPFRKLTNPAVLSSAYDGRLTICAGHAAASQIKPRQIESSTAKQHRVSQRLTEPGYCRDCLTFTYRAQPRLELPCPTEF